MENFKPTEEQLFDYLLDELDDKTLQQKIAVYLKNNPEVAEELGDWTRLETTYKNALIASPSSKALQNVREMALREMQAAHPQTRGFVTWSFFKKWAVTFSVVAIAGLAAWSARHLLPGQTPVNLAQDANLHTDHLAAVTAADAANTNTGLNAAEEAWAKEQLEVALQAFENKDFTTANQSFGQIANRYPQFSQNKTLYTYWIESLKQLGQFDLAAEKRTQLEALGL